MTLVTANVISRVLELKTSTGRATAFTLDQGERQYLVTARHLFEPGDSTPTVTVSNAWLAPQDLQLDLLEVDPPAADVAVAPLATRLTTELELPATFTGFGLSQQVHFLGYPYGLATEVSREGRQRAAFIKGATVSASAWVDGVHLIYLDGINNPGFSGGPVVGQPSGTGSRLTVCGVVAGYRSQTQPVYIGAQPIAAIRENTGIIITTQIAHVTDAIHKHQTTEGS
jgi:hypothetical protein